MRPRYLRNLASWEIPNSTSPSEPFLRLKRTPPFLAEEEEAWWESPISSKSIASLNLFSATGDLQQAPSPFFMTPKTQKAHCVVVIHPPMVEYTWIAYHTGSHTFLRKKFHLPNVMKFSASCSSFVKEYDGLPGNGFRSQLSSFLQTAWTIRC